MIAYRRKKYQQRQIYRYDTKINKIQHNMRQPARITVLQCHFLTVFNNSRQFRWVRVLERKKARREQP